MSKINVRTMDFFDRYNIKLISEKYGFDEKTALRKFLCSETYKMLTDEETEIYKMSPNIVFNLWEAEQVTGNPRNSLYIRGEAE